MSKYELAVVLSEKLEDEERAAAIERIQGYITRFGGTVTGTDEWGKKKLAYEIQKMSEAYYYFIHFDAESETPAELEAAVRIMEPVIRYLIVKQDDDAAPAPAPAPEKEAPAEEDAAAEEKE